MAQQNPSPASTSNSTPTSTPPSTLNPLPSTPDYKSLYRWAPDALLKEISSFTSLVSITAYRKKQTCHKSRVFGKDHDKYVRMVPCRVGEPVCSDESSDPERPFCFIYSRVFQRLGLRLPFTPFEGALLTEVNVAPAQLHRNSWAFVRVFAILCHCLGHTPSIDIFLYFFEAKSPSQKLWVSFNGVARRVLLTLFQQSYKGFKKHFFKVQCNRRDPTLLNEFPLY